MSQPSVSRIIAALEKGLGVALLHRSTRAVRLTDSGIDYLSRIETILDAMDEANQIARGTGGLKGQLRMGVSSSFGLREIVPRLPAFLELHPDLKLDLVVTDEVQNLILEGVDVAFRLGRLTDSGLLVRKLGQSARILVASPAYLRAAGGVDHPSDLRGRCLIVGPGAGENTLDFNKDGQVVSTVVEGRVSCSNNEGATALACAGLGITVTAAWGVRREIEQGALVRLLVDWQLPPFDLHAVYPSSRITSPAAKALVDYLAALLPNDRA